MLPRHAVHGQHSHPRVVVRCCPDGVTDAIDSCPCVESKLERVHNWPPPQVQIVGANVFATRRLNTVPVAMPRMPPPGLLNAVILADYERLEHTRRNCCLGKILCRHRQQNQGFVGGRPSRFRWNTLLVQENTLLVRFSHTPRKSLHPTSTPVQGGTQGRQLECPATFLGSSTSQLGSTCSHPEAPQVLPSTPNGLWTPAPAAPSSERPALFVVSSAFFGAVGF